MPGTRILLCLLACLWSTGKASAQEQFYKGKTIRIIVGLSAGGGYDVYTRAVARHYGKHIPGNPAVVVENMVGAGSLIAANHVYKVAKPDGLTIGHFLGGLFLQQVLGKPGIEFDGKNSAISERRHRTVRCSRCQRDQASQMPTSGWLPEPW